MQCNLVYNGFEDLIMGFYSIAPSIMCCAVTIVLKTSSESTEFMEECLCEQNDGVNVQGMIKIDWFKDVLGVLRTSYYCPVP
jgi:hypothetical protein